MSAVLPSSRSTAKPTRACMRRGWPIAVIAAWLVGCDQSPPPPNPYDYSQVPIKFKDDAQTNATVDLEDLDLKFVDLQGKQVSLQDFRGQKHVVLVFTRGFTGQICPFCTTQTSRLIANYKEFTQRDAEVLAVYPGDGSKAPDFLKAVQAQSASNPAEPPFPLLLDEELAAVDQLGIRGNLAKPSTYILDKQGQVRFAYVGAHTGDRPSVKALLAQLDAIIQEQPSQAAPSP